MSTETIPGMGRDSALLYEESEPAGEPPLTPEQTYKRVKPFLDDLYGFCYELGMRGQLTEAALNGLADLHDLPHFSPDVLLPVIETVELPRVIEAANDPIRFMIENPDVRELSPNDIAKAPWPMVLAHWHLLSATGHPPNPIFEALYAA